MPEIVSGQLADDSDAHPALDVLVGFPRHITDRVAVYSRVHLRIKRDLGNAGAGATAQSTEGDDVGRTWLGSRKPGLGADLPQ